MAKKQSSESALIIVILDDDNNAGKQQQQRCDYDDFITRFKACQGHLEYLETRAPQHMLVAVRQYVPNVYEIYGTLIADEANICIQYGSRNIRLLEVIITTASTYSDGFNPLLRHELMYCAVMAQKYKLLKALADTAVVIPRALDRSPLHTSAYYGDISALKILLRSQCINVNSMDSSGNRALVMTAANRHLEAMELLLNCEDVNVLLVDGDGLTALDWTVLNADRVAMVSILMHPRYRRLDDYDKTRIYETVMKYTNDKDIIEQLFILLNYDMPIHPKPDINREISMRINLMLVCRVLRNLVFILLAVSIYYVLCVIRDIFD